MDIEGATALRLKAVSVKPICLPAETSMAASKASAQTAGAERYRFRVMK